jgi:hypothetical protein
MTILYRRWVRVHRRARRRIASVVEVCGRATAAAGGTGSTSKMARRETRRSACLLGGGSKRFSGGVCVAGKGGHWLKGRGDLRRCRPPRLQQYRAPSQRCFRSFFAPSVPLFLSCRITFRILAPSYLPRCSTIVDLPRGIACNEHHVHANANAEIKLACPRAKHKLPHRLCTLEPGPACDDCSYCATHCSLGPTLSTADCRLQALKIAVHLGEFLETRSRQGSAPPSNISLRSCLRYICCLLAGPLYVPQAHIGIAYRWLLRSILAACGPVCCTALPEAGQDERLAHSPGRSPMAMRRHHQVHSSICDMACRVMHLWATLVLLHLVQPSRGFVRHIPCHNLMCETS